MPEPLLRTKLSVPPPRSNYVSRPRLLQRLNQGLQTGHKLTLISAAAGFGKTTLISTWAAELQTPLCWLTLDESDNDSARFLGYFLAALESLDLHSELDQVPVPETLKEINLTSVAIPLLNVLQQFTEHCALVIEDYHLIENTIIQAFIAYLVEHIPVHIHFYICTRADPALPLSRLRAHGQLSELRATDLRFSRAEIEQFFFNSMGLDIDERSIDAIDAKTEGWAAALRLTALAIGQSDDVGGVIENLRNTPRTIADYLADEVLANQPPAVTVFLLKTSILNRLAEELCRVVVGDEDNEVTLAALERENLFLTTVDDEGVWYQYHHLFASLLRKRLAKRYPEMIPQLHGRASSWYEQQGLSSEAIVHSLAAGNQDRAAQLIENNILDAILQGEFYLAQSWLNALPDEMRNERLVLLVARVWVALRDLSVERAEEYVHEIESLVPDGKTSAREIGNQASVLRAVVARSAGKTPEDQMALLSHALKVVPPDDLALQGILHLRLGFCLLDLGHDAQADETFQRVIAMGQVGYHTYNVFLAIYARTVIAMLQGRLFDVETICRESLLASLKTNIVPWKKTVARGYAFIALGLVELERNNLDTAKRNLTRGVALNKVNGPIELQVKGEYALGRLQNAQGKLPAEIDRSKLSAHNLPELHQYAQALQAHLWLLSARRGNASVLRNAVQWTRGQTIEPLVGYSEDWQVERHLIHLRILLTHDPKLIDLSATLSFLEGFAAFCAARQWDARAMEIALVKAIILAHFKQHDIAVEALGQALALAEASGHVRIFLDEGEEMAQLLYRCLENGVCPRYAGFLLAQYNHSSQSAATESDPAFMLEPLTRREVEVLGLISTGLTNREIGQKLSISLGTVKRHTANIFGKLNVNTRTQAVAVARQLNILT